MNGLDLIQFDGFENEQNVEEQLENVQERLKSKIDHFDGDFDAWLASITADDLEAGYALRLARDNSLTLEALVGVNVQVLKDNPGRYANLFDGVVSDIESLQGSMAEGGDFSDLRKEVYKLMVGSHVQEVLEQQEAVAIRLLEVVYLTEEQQDALDCVSYVGGVTEDVLAEVEQKLKEEEDEEGIAWLERLQFQLQIAQANDISDFSLGFEEEDAYPVEKMMALKAQQDGLPVYEGDLSGLMENIAAIVKGYQDFQLLFEGFRGMEDSWQQRLEAVVEKLRKASDNGDGRKAKQSSWMEALESLEEDDLAVLRAVTDVGTATNDIEIPKMNDEALPEALVSVLYKLVEEIEVYEQWRKVLKEKANSMKGVLFYKKVTLSEDNLGYTSFSIDEMPDFLGIKSGDLVQVIGPNSNKYITICLRVLEGSKIYYQVPGAWIPKKKVVGIVVNDEDLNDEDLPDWLRDDDDDDDLFQEESALQAEPDDPPAEPEPQDEPAPQAEPDDPPAEPEPQDEPAPQAEPEGDEAVADGLGGESVVDGPEVDDPEVDGSGVELGAEPETVAEEESQASEAPATEPEPQEEEEPPAEEPEAPPTEDDSEPAEVAEVEGPEKDVIELLNDENIFLKLKLESGSWFDSAIQWLGSVSGQVLLYGYQAEEIIVVHDGKDYRIDFGDDYFVYVGSEETITLVSVDEDGKEKVKVKVEDIKKIKVRTSDEGVEQEEEAQASEPEAPPTEPGPLEEEEPRPEDTFLEGPFSVFFDSLKKIRPVDSRDKRMKFPWVKLVMGFPIDEMSKDEHLVHGKVQKYMAERIQLLEGIGDPAKLACAKATIRSREVVNGIFLPWTSHPWWKKEGDQEGKGKRVMENAVLNSLQSLIDESSSSALMLLLTWRGEDALPGALADHSFSAEYKKLLLGKLVETEGEVVMNDIQKEWRESDPVGYLIDRMTSSSNDSEKGIYKGIWDSLLEESKKESPTIPFSAQEVRDTLLGFTKGELPSKKILGFISIGFISRGDDNEAINRAVLAAEAVFEVLEDIRQLKEKGIIYTK